MALAQLRGGIDEALLGNIDRDVGDRILEMFEQHPRLHAGAGAEADQLRVRADRFGHFAAVTPQELGLGAGDVILRQLADFLEQLRAALIVEKFAGKRTRRTGESGDDFGEKIRADRLEIEHV